MSKVLGARLRAARKALHPTVTQREAAKRLGLSPSAINLWEAGKTEPDSGALVELSKWYGVSIDWLVGMDVPRPKTGPKVPIWTVPLVSLSDMQHWRADAPLGLLQTAVAYQPQTAVAVQVESDALARVCPHGSYAVVSRAHECSAGSVVAAAVSRVSDPVIRKLVKEGRDSLLVADDVRYPSITLAAGVRLIGRVTEVVTRTLL